MKEQPRSSGANIAVDQRLKVTQTLVIPNKEALEYLNEVGVGFDNRMRYKSNDGKIKVILDEDNLTILENQISALADRILALEQP